MRIHPIQGSAPYWESKHFLSTHGNKRYIEAVAIGRDIGTGPYDLWDDNSYYHDTGDQVIGT